jgi:hypothetical protein
MRALVATYVAGLSIYHVWTGAISYFAPGFAMRFYRRLYDCNPVEQRHLHIILRPWGALALFAGVVGLATLPDPRAHPVLTGALALLLALRVGYRVRLRHELHAISGIAPARNWANIAVLVLGIMILATACWTGLRPAP